MTPGDEDEGQDGDPTEQGPGAGGAETGGQNGVEDDSDDAAEQPGDQEDDGESEEGVDEPARPKRGENRFQTLANERRVQQERADRLDRELQEERRQRQIAQQRQDNATEAERLALMTPEERLGYSQDRFQREMRNTLQQTQLQMQVAADQNAYGARAAIDPLYKKYQERVETQFQELLGQGKPTDRETILTYLLGKDARERAANPKVRAAAAKRVENQRVSAGGNRSDKAPQRGRQTDTAENRLKGQFI